MAEHTGTHVAAPAHIHPSMMDHTIDTIDVGWQKHWKTGEEGAFYAVNAPGLDESTVKLLSQRGSLRA